MSTSECENEVWSIIIANKDNETALTTLKAPPWVSASEFRGMKAVWKLFLLLPPGY
jgi:hypothetical protein